MSKVVLPYLLREGQVAYAARVMANFNALLDRINSVTLPGMAETDLEDAVQQLKLLLDKNAATLQQTLAGFFYDGQNQQLVISRKDGGKFKVNVADFCENYQGADSSTISVAVDGDSKISASIKEGAVNYGMLDSGLQDMISGKITANSSGNADQVFFSDGESFQSKLDSGQLRGADAVVVPADNIYYFRLGSDGHLYMGVPDDA